MEMLIPIYIFVIFITWNILRAAVKDRRKLFIEKFEFPIQVRMKISKKYPNLSECELNLAIKALRQFFHVCNYSNGSPIAMPSKVVDIGWHEFILHTRVYQQFCYLANGRYIHHCPFTEVTKREDIQDSFKRCWYSACQFEEMYSKSPSDLPLVFGIDSILNIPDGNRFSLTLVDKLNVLKVNQKNTNVGDSEELLITNIFECSSDAGGCGGCGGCGGG